MYYGFAMCSSHKEVYRAVCMAEDIRIRWKVFPCGANSGEPYAEGHIETLLGIGTLENPEEGTSSK